MFYIFIYLPDSWGDPFPNPHPEWDLIIASDILLCKHFILISVYMHHLLMINEFIIYKTKS